MKKLLLGLSVLLSFSVSAQWNTVSIGATQDLYSVDYYSSNDIWIGSFNQFIKTTTGGASWNIVNPLTDLSSASILPANVNDIALTSPTSAIATGLYFMGNTEVILRTTNSGANWDYATTNSSVPLLRYINSLDMNGARMIGVGNTGRLFRSTTTGASWTLTPTGTTNMINDVKFSSFDTVYASGNNIMLRSYDGGATWTILSVTGDHVNLACKGHVVYATKSYATTMIKSTNSGVSYSTINLPFTTRGAIHAVSKDTILASGSDGIYISRNGGTYWEKYVLSSYQVIEMFDFMSSNNGFAVGLGGYVLRTSNLNAAPSAPISMYTIMGGATSFCLDDSITFINSTAPIGGYTYQWKLDGTTFSTSYNAGKKLTTSGSHIVSLIVNNGVATDTTSITINVVGHDMNPLIFSASADSICTGNIAGFSVTTSQVGVNYQLRKGFLNVGPVQAGNGGTLYFSSLSPVTTTTAFNMKAVKTTSCFTDSLLQNKTIYLFGSSTPVMICAQAFDICGSPGYDPGITNVSFGTMTNASNFIFNNYFDYSCCKNMNVTMGNSYPISVTTVYSGGEYVKVWIDYNNDGIFNTTTEVALAGYANPTISGSVTIPTTTVFNQKVRMRVASDTDSGALTNACDFSCGEIEDYSVTILPAPVLPIASFTKVVTAGCSTNVTVTNTTYNGTSFTWNFGDGSPVVTTTNATHNYSIAGTYIIKLKACNPTGCDSTTQSITVVIPQVPIPAGCNPTMINGYVGVMDMFEFDTMNLNYTLYDGYQDLTCTKQQILHAASTYNIVSSLEIWSSCGRLAIWIDYNNDGLFTQFERINRVPGINSVCAGGYFPFPVQIPETAVLNTPLRLRALAYEPGYCGMPAYIEDGCNGGGCITGGNMFDYTVFILPALPVTVGFTASSTTSCTSNYVSFNNTSTNATHYLWDFGDGTTDTTVGSTGHMYATAGTYTVKLRVSNNLYADSLIQVNYITINASLPVPVITRSGNVLSTVAVAPGYQWYRNGVLISGATSSSYIATLDGNYVLNVINSNGCVTPSVSFAYFPPHVNFTASPTTGCGATVVFLNNTSTNCTTYTVDWGDGSPLVYYSPPGGVVHNYTIPGVFTMKLIGCGAMGCDSLIRVNYISMGSIPSPVITLIGSQLSTPSGAASYVWYLNGSPIGGATSNIYTPVVDGNYTVKYTDGVGCSATSAVFPYYHVAVVYYADTLGYCGVSSASVNFTNASTNATSYLWDFGDGFTSTLTSPTHVYAAPGAYTVKLKACGTLGCDSLTYSNYIQISSSALPSISISPPGPISYCAGDSVVLYTNSFAGFSYQWQYFGTDISGAIDTSFVVSNSAGDYNLIVSNAIGCEISSNTVTANIDFECVWPGDTDQSYVVDNYDLLPIGLFYGQTGTPRASIDNSWSPFPAVNWGVLHAGWMDIKQIDCNGDGTIDDNDTLAINLNYTSVHSIAQPSSTINRSADPDLYCVTSNPTYIAGDWIDVDIMAGTSAEQVADLYGIAFSLLFDANFVEPGTASLIFADSWLTDAASDGLSIGRVEMLDYVAHSGLTRISHTAKSGFGKLATFRFQASTSISFSQMMYFEVYEYYATDDLGAPLPFDYNIYYEIQIDPLITNTSTYYESNAISIHPNPFAKSTTISYSLNKDANVSVEVFNTIGQKIETIVNANQQAGEYKYSFSAKEKGHDAGIYFVKFTIDGKTTMRKIVEVK